MDFASGIAQRLLDIGAVKLSPLQPFTWASGILSPIYCDNRLTLSHPDVRSLIKRGFVEASANFAPFDVVAGVATAGIPHGVLLADALDKAFIYVRSSPKDHGRRNQIEGELRPGSRVLVVEDLVSTGGSCMKAVEAVQAEGAEVAGVLAVFQYEFESALALFAEKQIPFETLTNYSVLIETALKAGYIRAEELKMLQNWKENPQGWGALYA